MSFIEPQKMTRILNDDRMNDKKLDLVDLATLTTKPLELQLLGKNIIKATV